MSIITESGAGLPDAETYASVEDADAYFAKRSIGTWLSLTLEAKEASLIKATDYMTQTLRGRWSGERSSSTQALCWPRAGVLVDGIYSYPNNAIPREVKNACAELALRASIGELNKDQSARVLQETIGPVTVKYDEFAPQATQYNAVMAMLGPYLRGSRNVMKLGRS